MDTENQSVIPLCMIGNKGLYINAEGKFFPCCWVANRYNHNNEWMEISTQFDLNNKSLDQVINDEFWSNRFENFAWSECKDKCNIAVVDYNYATNW